MMNIRVITAVSLLLSLIYISCYDEMVNNPVGNKAPDTFLFLYPDSTISQQTSKLKVNWSGDDPDGIITGFFFRWEGIDTAWSFTTKNDSIFSLSIGTSDTTYSFVIAAVDDGGNGIYDQSILQNGENFGAEPFVDANGDGKYNDGEIFYDIGLIDPTPARLHFPIKNSPPVIEWNSLTVLPSVSFPVMSFGWNADDLDGVETVIKINISLNDTSRFVSLPGSTRLVTLRCREFNSPDPLSEILINGSESNIFAEKLSGIKLDDYNNVYIQAVDISGATSSFVPVSENDSSWYVIKPKGKLLIIDNYKDSQVSAAFYNSIFNSIGVGSLAGKFDVLDVQNTPLPYENLTFPETMKLFQYSFWYSNYEPRLDLLALVTTRYREQGGKIVFSMTFQDSISAYPFELPLVQLFLPIDSLGQKKSLTSLFANADIIPSAGLDYPELKTTATIGFVRTFYPSEEGALVYNLSSAQLSGPIGIRSVKNDLFFIGLPLHSSNANNNVDELLEKIFFQVMGLVP